MKGKIILLISVLLFCFSYSNAQTWLWAKEGSADLYGADPKGGDHSVACDNFGNAYYFGEFYDTLAFGVYKLYSPNMYNSFYVKYDKHGNVRWAKQSKTLINTSSATIYNVATDVFGNSIFAGYFKGTVVFDSDTLVGSSSSQIFLLKYDSTGNLLWAKNMANIPFASMASDLNGNIYLMGAFNGTLSIGTYVLTSTYLDIFLAKFGPNGNVLWAKHSLQGSTVSYMTLPSFALNKSGETYLTGNFTGAMYFGSDTLMSQSVYDYFLIKYDTSGNIIWDRQSKSTSSTSNASTASLAIDGSGAIYLTGDFYDTVYFGLDTLRSTYSKIEPNVFLVKYDSSGNTIWAEQAYMGPHNEWSGISIACDTLIRGGGYLALKGLMNKQGYSYKVGIGADTFNYTTQFYYAQLVLKFDSLGNTKCGAIFSEGIEDDGDGFNVDPSGDHVYFVGDLADTAFFGNDTLPCNRTIAELPFIACWRPCYAPILDISVINNNINELKVFPNPSNGKFTLEVKNDNVNMKSVEVFNVLGKKVASATLRQVQGDNLIDLSEQPNGVYFYRVLGENGGLIGEGKVVIEK